MYTIGQLAKRFSLSRSTLLYYDSIGLLSPSGRSDSNYRLYSETDIGRMEKIAQYRETGLSLEAIAKLLYQDESKITAALEARLFQINDDIQNLRVQQNIIISLLKNTSSIKNARALTKEKWVGLLKATGLNDQDMDKWHVEFEKMSPEAHQDFLESLGLEESEIKSIRSIRDIE